MQQPCRPYRIGDHGRAERNRLLRSMLIAVVVAALLSVVIPIGLGVAVPGEVGRIAANVAAAVTLPVAFVGLHWAIVGPRRWAALEMLIWAGRQVIEEFRAETGLRDPTDRAAGSAWVAEHPPREGEPATQTYWRVYLHVLTDDLAAARAELIRLDDVPGFAFERAELAGEVALAEGAPVDVDVLQDAMRGIADPIRRAVAAVNVGALAAQIAWTCGGDDVGPVLAQRPMVGDAARGTLLRHYWLPFVLVTVASMGALVLIGALLT